MDRFTIPKKHLHEIVEGVTLDLANPFLIENREQLEHYCYLVASSVGLACLSIWDGNKSDVHQAAIDCGFAFQLTNILRDVNEDRERGRIYVPRDLLLAYQVEPERWLQGQPNGDWKAVLETLIAWAEDYYSSGRKLIPALNTDGRRMFSLMWETYRRLLKRIACDVDSVWKRRVGLSTIEKSLLYAQHAITPWYRQLSLRYESDD